MAATTTAFEAELLAAGLGDPTNLLTNPSFEADLSRWAVTPPGATTATRVADATAPGGAGGFACEVVTAGAAGAEGIRLADTPASGLLIPAAPGDSLSVGAFVQRMAGSLSRVRVQVNFRDAADATPAGGNTVLDLNYGIGAYAWVAMVSSPAPPTTAWARIYFTMQSGPANVTFRIACAIVQKSQWAPDQYFDGSMPGYGWTGAANTSTSQKIQRFPSPAIGLMQGANYKLRRAYLDGVADPAAHTIAKGNPRQLKALQVNGKLASFDAITAP